MSQRKTLLAASILASLCFAGSLQAQDTATTNSPQSTGATTNRADKGKVQELGAITVTGIRDSEAESLALKRDANSKVEIVTAEDIGKLPAKNVADTLQRLPGVNISSASATEGGFDENDRVSLRGTNPSLTQTLVNGHSVGTGDWFVLSQVQTVGRSVSYSLLPAEIVSQVVVHKTSEARIVEGGAAGSVDIITRKPLEFAKPITAELSVGGVYADLPSNTKPQASALFNFKNEANNFGVTVQGFYEKRSLQREGQEVVGGYSQIAADAPVTVAHPDLANVYYPNLIGATLFTQTRERKGGVVDIQWKPTDNLSLNLNGFYSKLKADNYNRNYLLWASRFVPSGAGLQPGYSVDKNGVLTNATFAPPGAADICAPATADGPAVTCANTPYGVYDQISRPGASSQSKYLTLDADWHVTDHFSLKGQIGTTRGKGESPTQDVLELGNNAGGGAFWAQQGLGKPINWNVGNDNSSPVASGYLPSAGYIFGDQFISVKDKEDFFTIDGESDFDDGALSSLQFGVRYAKHTRENPFDVGQAPFGDWQNLANYPTTFSNYPSDFASGIGGAHPDNIWYYSPGQLKAFDNQFTNRDPVTRFNWQNVYKVQEKDKAVYVQANFSGDRWSGNVGLRYVRTEEDINYNTSNPDAFTAAGPFTGSAFGPYYKDQYKHTYNEVLPSANLKFDLTDSVVARFAASETMTRPDYSALAGSVSLNDLSFAGSGGNPQLKPIISTNFDGGIEWYFAPRGLLSFSAFQLELRDYVNFGTVNRVYKNQNASTAAGADVFTNYRVSVPVNVDGSLKGVELNYIQPIGEHFGVSTNYTFADGSADGGGPLQGTSKRTFNMSGFYEDAKFNARLSYTYRSEFYAGVDRADTFYQSGIGNLAFSAGYQLTDWMSVSLDALNLNKPTLKYYTKSDVYGKQPHAFYDNGRQYYLNLRFKF